MSVKSLLEVNRNSFSEVVEKVLDGDSLGEAVNSTFKNKFNIYDKYRFFDYCENRFSGFDEKLFPLVNDPAVTDIMINGDGFVWVDTADGLQNTGIVLEIAQVKELAIRLASMCEKRLDNSSPIVDGTLNNGIRFNAILEPVSYGGACISLRLQRKNFYSFDSFFAKNSLHYRIAPILRKIVENKCSILISGATGSGKTTLLSALTCLFPKNERVLFIEETREIVTKHANSVFLQSRDSNIEGKGEITLSDLVHAAMRMRPDRIILGECRGKEIADILNSFNTGHEGGICTIHANSVQDTPARLIALGKLAGLDLETLFYQVSSALKIVIHLDRRKIGSRVVRWVSQIGLFELDDSNRLVCSPCVLVKDDGQIVFLPAWKKLKEMISYEDSICCSNLVSS